VAINAIRIALKFATLFTIKRRLPHGRVPILPNPHLIPLISSILKECSRSPYSGAHSNICGLYKRRNGHSRNSSPIWAAPLEFGLDFPSFPSFKFSLKTKFKFIFHSKFITFLLTRAHKRVKRKLSTVSAGDGRSRRTTSQASSNASAAGSERSSSSNPFGGSISMNPFGRKEK
jgi:hypothetical protein